MSSSDLAAREARLNDCRRAIYEHMHQFHLACSVGDYDRAEHVRLLLTESLDAALDATVAFFKGISNGQA
jgi:hypothetical protein